MSQYRLTFEPGGKRVDVDTDTLQEPRDGLRGSILQLALENGIEIDHACGGVCACATCHIIVREGASSFTEADDDEEDQLDNAPGLTLQSRLACQAVPDGSQDVVIEIPSWNRNLVSEEH